MTNNQLIQNLMRKVKKFNKNRHIYFLLTTVQSIIFKLAFYFGFAKKGKFVEAKLFNGSKLIVKLPESVSESIYRYGFFEEGLTYFLITHLKSGNVFFDIGAHFGYFTNIASEIIGNVGSVHAFEPTPSTYELLCLNSDKANIITNRNAVFSSAKNITLNDYGILNSSFNSIYHGRLGGNVKQKIYSKKFEVSTITIDQYVIDKGVIPNLIKIDAENAEYEILLGMKNTIVNYKPIITLEVGDKNAAGAISSRKLIDYMIDNNYQPFYYKNMDFIKLTLLSENYEYDNLFFIPLS
jgi:FkbM family methyltransferase